MTYTRKRQNLKTKRRNPKSRVTKRHKKKTNRRKRGGREPINPCDTAILSTIKNSDIEASAKLLCNKRNFLELLENKYYSVNTHNTCEDFLKSPEPNSKCQGDTCKDINTCILAVYNSYKQDEQSLYDLINTKMDLINTKMTKMKKIEDNMFALLERHKFDFNETSVQNHLYGQIDDLTSINLFNEEFEFDENSPSGKSSKNKSCHDIGNCVESQKIFLTIIISHLHFYTEHDLKNEKQSLLTMITTNADAIKTIIPYHMNDNSLQEGLTLLQQEVPALKK
jgi:hypothetical protein